MLHGDQKRVSGSLRQIASLRKQSRKNDLDQSHPFDHTKSEYLNTTGVDTQEDSNTQKTTVIETPE
jgi:hypothetical protein